MIYPRLKGESTQTNFSLTKWVIPSQKDRLFSPMQRKDMKLLK